jgi:hypothetical protein
MAEKPTGMKQQEVRASSTPIGDVQIHAINADKLAPRLQHVS